MPLESIKRRADFLSARNGDKDVRSCFVMQMRNRKDAKGPRVGYTVTKKLGNAVIRNRIKRKLRAAVNEASEQFANGCDYVVIGRQFAHMAGFEKIQADLTSAIQRLNRRRNRGEPKARVSG